MAAIGKNKQEKSTQLLGGETPEEILQRRRNIESRVGDSSSSESKPTGLAAEKAVGALCYLPKSIHRLASRAAEDRDLTAKRFFFELVLDGLLRQEIITEEQYKEAFALPNEYGWKGRKSSDSSSSSQ
jgi:hypothetical protein